MPFGSLADSPPPMQGRSAGEPIDIYTACTSRGLVAYAESRLNPRIFVAEDMGDGLSNMHVVSSSWISCMVASMLRGV